MFLESAPQIENVISGLFQQKIDYEYFFFNLVDAPNQLVASGNYLALLVPILAGVSTLIFSKITMAQSQPAPSADGNKTAQETQAESMMKVMNIMMPVMMGFISYTVPSGLALYWIAGNLIMMVQQILVGKLVNNQMKEIDEQIRKEREAEAKRNPQKKKKKKKKPVTQSSDDTSSTTSDNDTNNLKDKPKKERKQPGKEEQ